MAQHHGNIYTPRISIHLLARLPNEPNKSMCTVIPYHGFEISIAMDSNHGDGNLSRSSLCILDDKGGDVTDIFLPEYAGSTVIADADALKEAFAAIEDFVQVAQPA